MAFEQTLAQINQCFVYKLPPRTNMRGYRAADWNASEPLWQVSCCCKCLSVCVLVFAHL